MKGKYNQTYEDHIKTLAEMRLEHKNFKVFDHRSRVIKRQKIENDGQEESCLVVINGVGDCIVLTESFERSLYWVGKQRFEQ
jgi:hypothetical protein